MTPKKKEKAVFVASRKEGKNDSVFSELMNFEN
jgi:hypothetical protein